MRLITKAEADEIGEKITEQERRTSGEIVAVLAAQSGSYRLMPLFIAAFVALLVPLVMLYLPLLTSGRVVV